VRTRLASKLDAIVVDKIRVSDTATGRGVISFRFGRQGKSKARSPRATKPASARRVARKSR
jgi:hypothetical protein